ncbi:sensor histidine kinase [uncultured Tessaracoccus sp.]|uniref:sensor histidine kinase n=1 Tax=uncultured Tessaracoccus sp. TaxID=905023 RepID=UPI0025ED0EA2|nr:sensor histidine kinase [uncultured Tessaracoccus sp.]
MGTSWQGATQWLLRGLDVLVVGLVVLAAISGGAAGHRAWVTAPISAAFLGLYALGRVGLRVDREPLDPRRARWWPDGAWLATLVVVWLGLLWLTDTALWVAFPLMLLSMHVLGPRLGLVGTGFVTLVAVVHGVRGGDGWESLGSVLGPVVGAALSVAVVLGLEALAREAQRKQALIDELTAARGYLADAERDRTVLAERARLAREIHDTLAQGLAGIDLLLRAALPQLPDGPGAELVERAGQTARDNLVEARRVVHALSPAGLEGQTLVAALRRAVERVAETHPGLEAELVVAADPGPLPMPVEAALLRIAQSALANVAQHARASHCRVVLDHDAGSVALAVEDDGVGLDRAEPPSGGRGFGLPGMRARVRELGGELRVESAPGEGTRVVARIDKEAE